MEAPIWFLVLFVGGALWMLFMFATKREAIADAQRYTARRVFGRDMPRWFASGGSWFNIVVAGFIAVAGIVSLVAALL